jgi:hypothetical protein
MKFIRIHAAVSTKVGRYIIAARIENMETGAVLKEMENEYAGKPFPSACRKIFRELKPLIEGYGAEVVLFTSNYSSVIEAEAARAGFIPIDEDVLEYVDLADLERLARELNSEIAERTEEGEIV